MQSLFLVSFADIQQYFWVVAGIIGMIWLYKSGIIQDLTGGQKKLIDLRTAELTREREENARLGAKLKELEEYNRLLILNARTTMEVMNQLKGDKGHV